MEKRNQQRECVRRIFILLCKFLVFVFSKKGLKRSLGSELSRIKLFTEQKWAPQNVWVSSGLTENCQGSLVSSRAKMSLAMFLGLSLFLAYRTKGVSKPIPWGVCVYWSVDHKNNMKLAPIKFNIKFPLSRLSIINNIIDWYSMCPKSILCSSLWIRQSYLWKSWPTQLCQSKKTSCKT